MIEKQTQLFGLNYNEGELPSMDQIKSCLKAQTVYLRRYLYIFPKNYFLEKKYKLTIFKHVNNFRRPFKFLAVNIHYMSQSH